MRVYLDVCCLNRPFDDTSQERVAHEAEAVAAIMTLVERGLVTDYSSEMVQIELDRMLNLDRRRKVTALLPPKERIMSLTNELLDAANEIVSRGFPLADAVHLAAALQLKVDAFVTVDDRLARRTVRHSREMRIRVVNPVALLQEFGDEING